MSNGFQVVRNLIQASKYSDAIQAYYEVLGDQYYSEYTKELLYLKILAQEQLSGRDLLYFLPLSSRNEIINENLDQYVILIDEIVSISIAEKRRMPIDILVDCVPTMANLVLKRNSKYRYGVNIVNGKFETEKSEVEEQNFTQMWDKCISGYLFTKFPDPVIFCRALEWEYPKKYFGFWILHSPDELKQNVYSKGLHINWLDIYLHKSWKYGSLEKIPAFFEARSLDDIRRERMSTSVITSNDPGDIRYTGRTHKISDIEFYEIDILWKSDFQTATVVSNPLIEQIDEILQEAENRLRVSKGLPRIGEGWMMETVLYKMVSAFFKDTLQHASPPWLKPQHLDIFIPSEQIGIEYHGSQHYEPVDFFGGKEAFIKNQQRDKRKMILCQRNGVRLVIWRYDTPVNKKQLIDTLKEFGVNLTC